MASYHLSVKSKNKGYAFQHYLYIARLMQYENVRKKSNEVLEYVEAGKCMPVWVKDPAEFWQAADTYERANAKVYMEYEIALPNEFTPEIRKTLIETFLEKYVVKHGYPHSWAIHNVKSRISKEEQPHCHLMFSLKVNDGIERTAEQYFKRYNPKDPRKGGAKKIQLQDGHADYSSFLMYIRKAWEDHLNDALEQYCPTVTYYLDGQEIKIKNRVSADSYEKYNDIHGTLYIPEPKLGAGNHNATPEYLEEIHKIRNHNAVEREREERQKQFSKQHEYFYSTSDEPFVSPEIMYYVNYLIKKAKNKDQLNKYLVEILKIQEPLLNHEKWDIHQLNRRLSQAQNCPEPSFEFKVHLPKSTISKQAGVSVPSKKSEKIKQNDHDFDGP